MNNTELNKSIIEKLKTCDIYKPVEGWVIEYPEFADITDTQMDTFFDVTNKVSQGIIAEDRLQHTFLSATMIFGNYWDIYVLHI